MGKVSEYPSDNYGKLHYEMYYILMTFNITVALAALLAACALCKRKFPKRPNELLGLEGMVKLKNPDEVVVISAGAIKMHSESQADLNLSTVSNADSEKRASTAAHRSLPDIPVNDDNGSELYETVAEKQLVDGQNHHETAMSYLKKQSSVSQHSSISQADDSPYSRVKNSPHDYAKVRSTEHPYAQLNAPPSIASNVTASHGAIGGGGAAASAVIVPGAAAIAAAAAVASTSNISSTSGGGGGGNGSACGGVVANSSQLTLNDSLHRSSHHSDSSQNVDDSATESQVDIPAASAIAGMVSASQDLPYMTPPIANQHFSGDSQDSSKGYTSISVREPLANILAQQPVKPTQRIPPLSRDVNDSHYATVSDDSDETYAAIEDPTSRQHVMIPIAAAAADIYTSGSETYAQIQPMQSNSIVVSVEINNTSSSPTNAPSLFELVPSLSSRSSIAGAVPGGRPSSSEHTIAAIPPPVDNLRAHMHSRQASSSSNVSCSVGNLGSPKPEKRQANSPLPPTPKSTGTLHSQAHTTSSSNLTSGRNSVISVIELIGSSGTTGTSLDGNSSSGTITTNDGSPQKKAANHKSLSPSKDIEGMYAKVMKKSKFSRHSPSSQDNSPILSRKHELGITPLNATAAELMETHKITVSAAKAGNGSVANSRLRSNSYGAKDHGYETIPANAAIGGNVGCSAENRKSDCYTTILQKERQLEGGQNYTGSSTSVPTTTPASGAGGATHAPPQPNETFFQTGQRQQRQEKHYETIRGDDGGTDAIAGAAVIGARLAGAGLPRNTDPGYEVLQTKPPTHKPSDLNDAKKSSDYDPNYEVLKDPQATSALSDDGYAKVLEKRHNRLLHDEDEEEDATDGYSKVKVSDSSGASSTAGYSTITEAKELAAKLAEVETDSNHNYASILETKHAALDKATAVLVATIAVAGDADSEHHYARIPEGRSLQLAGDGERIASARANVNDYRPLSPEMHNPRPPELPLLISPTAAKSSQSQQHNSSNHQTSSIGSSSVNITPTSTCTTLSSRQTPSSASQYESLTGSDTDPNYECVSYISKSATTTATPTTSTGATTPTHSTTSEQAYERLQTDYTQANSSSSLNTPDDSCSLGGKVLPTATTSNSSMSLGAGTGTATEVVVDDYFQV